MKIIMRKNIIKIVESKKGLMDFMIEVFSEEKGEEVKIHKIFDEGNVVITHAQIKNNGQYFKSVDRFKFTPKKNKGENK